MKIATWNVNGIRAREAQLCEWLERDRPDVVCLQELKAERARFPAAAATRTITSTGTGCARIRACRSTSARRARRRARVRHPEFDMESRIVQVELGNLVVRIGVRPERRQGLPGEDRLLDAARRMGERVARGGPRRGPVRRHQRRAHARSTSIRASASRASSVSGPRSAICSSGCSASTSSTSDARCKPDNETFHVVGAVAQHAPAQHRLAHRLHPRVEFDRGARHECVVLGDVGTSDHAPVMMTTTSLPDSVR